MKRISRRAICLLPVLVVFLGLVVWTEWDPGTLDPLHHLETAPRPFPSYVAMSTTEDDRREFDLDPELPFQVEFGQGSGWHGLDTVKIASDGSVTLHRSQMVPVKPWPIFFWMQEDSYSYWQTATMKLDAQAMDGLRKLVHDQGLLKLKKSYSASVCDGTQWVLWIKQGDHEKAVYFNNQFPDEIIAFAKSLDELLVDNGMHEVRWYKVRNVNQRQHEQSLWNSIER